MAQDKVLFDQNVTKLGEFSTYMAKGEMKYLPSILRSDEKIFAITSGQHNNKNYLIVVTDQRLIFLNKFLWKVAQAEFPISKITAIAHEVGLFFGTILATTASDKELFKMIPKKDVVRISSMLSEMIDNTARKTS